MEIGVVFCKSVEFYFMLYFIKLTESDQESVVSSSSPTKTPKTPRLKKAQKKLAQQQQVQQQQQRRAVKQRIKINKDEG